MIPDGKAMPAAGRLVVIIPPADFDSLELALKVSRLGRLGKKRILFLGLAEDPEKDSLLRRQMATLSSYVRGPMVESDYKLLFADHWVEALGKVLLDGDLLVCLEEHWTTGRFFRNIPLSNQLLASLDIPVCVIQGIQLSPQGDWLGQGFRNFLIWISLLLTLVTFLFVQVRIQQALPDALGTAVEVVSVGIEVWVLLRICSLGS